MQIPTESTNPNVRFSEIDESDYSAAELSMIRDARQFINRTEMFRSCEVDMPCLRYDSSDKIVPPSTFEDAKAYPVTVSPEENAVAYNKQQDASLKEYRENKQALTDEQRAEMRNAFGAGSTAVNVLTGETYDL